MIPYLMVILGVVSDWITTQIALSDPSRGFYYETHAVYSPVWATVIFFGALVILDVVLGDFKHKQLYMSLIACMSFLGAVNNALVLLGVFNGLVI